MARLMHIFCSNPLNFVDFGYDGYFMLIYSKICTNNVIFKGTDPKFWSKIAIFFFAEKASSGMWEIQICPKILGGYEY